MFRLLFAFSMTLISTAALGVSENSAPALLPHLTNRCGNKDLTDEVGPVRAQGNFGWCTYFSAADAITQRLSRANPGQPVQPVAVVDVFAQMNFPPVSEIMSRMETHIQRQAIQEFSTDTQERIHDRAGDTEVAVLAYNGRGVCLENQMPFQRQDFERRVSSQTQEELCRASGQDLRTFAQIERVAARDLIQSSCEPRTPTNQRFSVSTVEVSQTLNQNQRLNDNTAGTTIQTRNENAILLINKLNEALDNDRIAMIGYHASLFLTPERIARTQDTAHASTIVARRRVNGRCEYKIRNSWGTNSCHAYRTGFRERCQEGYIWVNETELVSKLFIVSYIR